MARKRSVISHSDAYTIVLSSIVAIGMSAVYDFYKTGLIEAFPGLPSGVPIAIAFLISIGVMWLPFRILLTRKITEN